MDHTNKDRQQLIDELAEMKKRVSKFGSDLETGSLVGGGYPVNQAFLQTVIDGLPESLMVVNLDFSVALAN